MATILTKRSNTASSVPLAADLTNSTNGAELAVNTADKRVFTKDSGGSVVELGTNPSALSLPNGTANGVPYLNGSKVLTSGSALTFDGTTFRTLSGAVASGGSVNGKFRLDRSDGATNLGYIDWVTANDGMRFFNNNGGYFSWESSSAGELARLTSTGLGIGTSSPTQKLTVSGNGVVSGSVTVGQAGIGDSVFQVYSASYGGMRIGYNSTAVNYIDSGTLNFRNAAGSSTFATLDSSGNLGIGTSSPAFKLDVVGSGAVYASVQNTSAGSARLRLFNTGDTSDGFALINNSGASGQVNILNYKNSAMAFWTNSTQQLTIDATGNLGVSCVPAAWGGNGTIALPNSGALAFQGTYGNVGANYYYNGGFKYTTTAAATLYSQGAGAHVWYTAPSGTAGNAISFTQAMSLDANGRWLLGTTSIAGYQNAGCFVYDTSNGAAYANHPNGAASGNVYLGFGYNGSGIGSITQNGTTAIAYNTSSDYRLKNITGPITTSGAYIDSLNPVEGTWKADGSTFVGLLAHEAQEASRTPVATGIKDGPEMQAMDYSSAEIIANLIAEVKSLRKRVAALEA